MHFKHHGVPDPESLVVRPPKYPYTIRGLLDFPRRLRCPPPPFNDARLPSYAVTPNFRVNLEDLIDGKHLPPLTVRDFEDYLLFVERSAQNLYAHSAPLIHGSRLNLFPSYFILWLKQYSERYSEWIAEDLGLSKDHLTVPTSPSSLAHNASAYLSPSRNLAYFFACAKETFFSQTSPLRLDVSNEVLMPFMRPPPPPDVTLSWADIHPPPQLLGPVKHEVERTLQHSLDSFVRISFTNTGNARRYFGMTAGPLVVALGLIPLWLSLFCGKSREYRLIGIPLFLLGFLMFLATKNGICLIIYSFGYARQLYAWELPRSKHGDPPPLRLTMSAPAPAFGQPSPIISITSPPSAHLRPESPAADVTITTSRTSASPRNSTSSITSDGSDHGIVISEAFPCEFSVSLPAPPLKASSRRDSLPPSPVGSSGPPPLARTFSGIPVEAFTVAKPFSPRDIQMMTPVTQVYSPLIMRAQWEIVARGMLVSLCLSIVLTCVIVSLPTKG
ncbi:hypothetical protein BOTBODRAFT_170629 [Botryobasidium botryosum FD-172 SS1]|uniref:RGS domain-containing protein n=1 Tax=Botryobasidium botryosum (strain FD-172 SS1) TaxID=930990 RepID=A0A067N5Y4_BOTB1|nr:hypothetical protein BOTBODRAFT_170629 [Botryobasidium botryosum FD-172 SS1]